MMSDYRPDLVFVVSSAVWQSFLQLREETGDALCLGFYRTTEANMKRAEAAEDDEALWHWRAVMSLGWQYGHSFISAVEVDGTILRETEKFPLWHYPDDADLTRVLIDGKHLDRVELRPERVSPFSETLGLRTPDGGLRITYSTLDGKFYTDIPETEILGLNGALLRLLPDMPPKFAADTLYLLGKAFAAKQEDDMPHEDLRKFLAEEGIEFTVSEHLHYSMPKSLK